MSTYSHQMESKKSVSPSMRALLFHSKLSHLSKKNSVEWLFAPFLFHYTLKECEQCQEEQFVQDHFILGIKSDLYLRQPHSFLSRRIGFYHLAQSSELLIFYESIKKRKVVKKRPKKTHTCSLDENGFKILCTEWWEWLNTIGSYFLHWNFEQKSTSLVKKKQNSTFKRVKINRIECDFSKCY